MDDYFLEFYIIISYNIKKQKGVKTDGIKRGRCSKE